MENKAMIEKCKKAAFEMRKDILYMALMAGKEGAHLGGSLSMTEIMSVLYMGVMKYDLSNCAWEERDRFILSKGHGVPAQYAAMVQAGLIDREELASFKKNDTWLTGHPTMNVEKGIEFSSGSLGQGLSLGVGTALALKRKKNDAKVFVLLGDGECDEGSVWEAAMSGAHYNLEQLCAIVDKNNLQYDGTTNDIMKIADLKKIWEAFGWKAIEVNGHNIEDLFGAFEEESDRPKVIIANTIKGKGVSFMEGNALWHHGKLSEKQYKEALEEIGGYPC